MFIIKGKSWKMSKEELFADFMEKYPDGIIREANGAKTSLEISFTEYGKMYRYKRESNIRLYVRFGLARYAFMLNRYYVSDFNSLRKEDINAIEKFDKEVVNKAKYDAMSGDEQWELFCYEFENDIQYEVTKEMYDKYVNHILAKAKKVDVDFYNYLKENIHNKDKMDKLVIIK